MTQDYDLLDLIEDIADEFASQARDASLHLGSFLTPELPRFLHGDKDAIEALIRFLVIQSIEQIRGLDQESTAHAVLVEALEQAEHSQPSQEGFRFAVSDTNTTLDISERENQVQSYLEMKTPLGTVQSLLERLNTKLHVDPSVIGRTSRVYFDATIVRGSVPSISFSVPEELVSTKIFLVSNDPPPNRVIQHYCRFAGIEIDGAPTAVESITELGRCAESNPFQILAIAPPIEDFEPFDLVHSIRDSMLSDLRLLYIAPWADAEDQDKAIKAGFDATIAKPFRRDELFSQLLKLAGRSTPPTVRQPHILIVEDNPINAKVAMFQLRALGYESETAENGLDALDALSSGAFDIVLMDLQMPVMDGIAATQAIRSGKAGDKDIPIIALTANDELKNKSLAAGCNFFLTKPAPMNELRSIIHQCVQININGKES